MLERDTYKYLLKKGRKVVHRGTTYNLTRREAEHQREFPGSRIHQVGHRTTREDALRWERQDGKRQHRNDK